MAIGETISLARLLGARITAYACLPEYPISPFSEVVVEPPPDFEERCESEAREHLQYVEDLASQAGVACVCHVSTHGAAYQGIMEIARQSGCDLIAMASHKRPGLSSWLSVSETQRVISHSEIPVLVYVEKKGH